MYEALFLPQNLSLETSVDNGLQTETKTIMPALGLPIVRISHRRGSLIPLPLSERREADHTIQQAVDRTIYTPHTSFHRLHKPYLLHAPSVEPRTADKHRPCQSPTGQRYKKSKGVYTSQLWHIHPFKVQLSKAAIIL